MQPVILGKCLALLIRRSLAEQLTYKDGLDIYVRYNTTKPNEIIRTFSSSVHRDIRRLFQYRLNKSLISQYTADGKSTYSLLGFGKVHPYESCTF